VTVSELARLDYDVEGWSSTEGIFIGYVVTFGPAADLAVLQRSRTHVPSRCLFLDQTACPAGEAQEPDDPQAL